LFQTQLPSLIDSALTLGHNYLVLPYLREHERPKTESDWKKFTEELSGFGETCQKAGIQFAYHNHAFEFETTPEGSVPLELILSHSDPSFVSIELDLYWVVKAGHDPLDLFSRFPGRFPLWHVKDMNDAGEFADVGFGKIDFERIFSASELSGEKHLFVEKDQTENALESIKNSYASMARLLNI
jgi:sugar phosphate isomerase/epimerase